jgi:spermidine synthase
LPIRTRTETRRLTRERWQRPGVSTGVIEQLIELAQAAPDARAFEAAVLARLQARIGFDVGFLSVRGAESEPTTVGLERPLIELAVTRSDTYARELLPVKRVALGARGVAVDTDVLGESRVQKQSYHRELASRVNGRHSLLAYLPWRSDTLGLLLLGRCGSSFSARECEQIEAMLPALGAARAAFGTPFQSRPLTPPEPTGLWSRLGLARTVHADVATAGGRIQVRDRGAFREMAAIDHDGAELIWTRAQRTDPRVSGWPYVNLFHVAAARAERRERALFIGAGGGVALRQFASVYPGIELTLVEKDARVIELGRAWFGLDALPRLRVTIEDGAEFVTRAAPGSWDIAVVDAFDTRSAAQPLLEASFLSSLARGLRPNGALALNWIGSLDSPALASFVRRIDACFDGVQLLPVVGVGELDSRAPRNVVIVALRRPLTRSP